jgi:hypothetical protein
MRDGVPAAEAAKIEDSRFDPSDQSCAECAAVTQERQSTIPRGERLAARAPRSSGQCLGRHQGSLKLVLKLDFHTITLPTPSRSAAECQFRPWIISAPLCFVAPFVS